MVVSDKIEMAKNCFGNIKTSGRNNYQKYDYLETRDIFPLVREVCRKFGLKTCIKADLDLHCFVLTITDRDDNSSEQFFAPYPELNSNDAGKYMQDFGRCQTYAQRYLYIQAFEIMVPDEIDNKNQQRGAKSVPKRSVNSTKYVSKMTQNKPNIPVQPIIEPKTEEVTEQDIKEALDKIYDIIVVQGGKDFTMDLAKFQLERHYKNKPQLVKACLNSLQINKAGGNKN